MKALLRQCFFISIITEDFALKRTTNYALPDWEKSDFIQMSDFNDLTHKLDTALKANADAAASKVSSAELNAVQQEVAAVREANCLVKLAGPLVTTADNAAMEFDLSQVDMTKVAALFVVFSAGSVGGTMGVSVNNTFVGTICTNNRSTSAGVAWLFPFGDHVASYAFSACDGDGLTSGGSGTIDSVNWTEITSVKVSGGSSAGATATLFAVKK